MSIGIPAGRKKGKQSSPYFMTREVDVKAVVAAGAIPVLLPSGIPLEEIPQLVEVMDGFLFTGGGDLEPSIYGESDHERVYGVNLQRDAFELALMRALLERDKPMLAICRGMQTLNVACGGGLYLDIASQLPEAGKHDWWPGSERNKLAHKVRIEPASKLGEILGFETLETNSLHHQAVRELGKGLQVVAKAEDGVVEAIEHGDKRFVIGVQWHPEWLQDQAPMRALYQAFVRACEDIK